MAKKQKIGIWLIIGELTEVRTFVFSEKRNAKYTIEGCLQNAKDLWMTTYNYHKDLFLPTQHAWELIADNIRKDAGSLVAEPCVPEKGWSLMIDNRNLRDGDPRKALKI
jgi:hypothetical protein